MKSINKKNIKILIFTLVAIITLGVGYATISAINLVINGNATASPNNSSFSVRFLTTSDNNGPVVSPNPSGNVNTVSVVGDREASFNVTSLSAAGDTAVATYKIKNESRGIGADISLSLSNTNSEYFKATVAVADSQLQAGDITEATVTVELLKTIIDESISTTITATLIASPIENENATGSSSATATPVTQIQYKYSISQNQIGQALVGELSTFENVKTAGYNVSSAHIVSGGVITESYVAFEKNNTVYYLRGGVDETSLSEKQVYNQNVSVLREAFGPDWQSVCTDEISNFSCSSIVCHAYATTYGEVAVYDCGGGFSVDSTGSSGYNITGGAND